MGATLPLLHNCKLFLCASHWEVKRFLSFSVGFFCACFLPSGARVISAPSFSKDFRTLSGDFNGATDPNGKCHFWPWQTFFVQVLFSKNTFTHFRCFLSEFFFSLLQLVLADARPPTAFRGSAPMTSLARRVLHNSNSLWLRSISWHSWWKINASSYSRSECFLPWELLKLKHAVNEDARCWDKPDVTAR